MTRNMEKTAERATKEIPGYYDINSAEIIDLMKKARNANPNDTFDAVVTAFKYGFVMGNRATVTGRVTKRL